MSEALVISAKFRPSGDHARELFQLAREALAKAAEQARQTVNAARRDAAQNIRRLREKTRACGYREGLRQGQAAQAQKLMELQSLYAETVAKANEDCLDLCLGVCREVIGAELKSRPRSLAQRIAQALDCVIEQHGLNVAVNPGERECVQAALEKMEKRCEVCLRASEEIAPGNALIETRVGSIELNWQEHLETLGGLLHARQSRGAAAC